ncbi:MAG: DegT/DnrJ/EryC1/StrS family aminotransferase [Chloroflexia bacterium]
MKREEGAGASLPGAWGTLQESKRGVGVSLPGPWGIGTPTSASQHSIEKTECERLLAQTAGRTHALLAPRATTALLALLRALDLPPNSEVLMPVALCANPAYAVHWAGLRPIFADISPTTFNLDLAAAERVIGPQTRVLLAVPLFGHPLDVPDLLEFAHEHNLILVEDAAQATGLSYADLPAGSLGICSVYSFGPGKIADAGGGAALLSNDPHILERAAAHLHSLPSNRHSDEHLPAGILRALQNLPHELLARATLAAQYRHILDHSGVTHPEIPSPAPLSKYSILLPSRPERDRATRELLAAGIPATNLYPPLAPYFPEARNATGHFPVASDLYNRIVNLPLWPQSTGMEERAARAISLALAPSA